MISAFTSNGSEVTFAEGESSSAAFDVDDDGTITLSAGAVLNFETAAEHTVAVTASALDAPDANFSVRITVVDVEEPPLQDGTTENPYLVAMLVELQSIGTGFSNGAVTTPLSAEDSLAASYRRRDFCLRRKCLGRAHHRHMVDRNSDAKNFYEADTLDELRNISIGFQNETPDASLSL